MKTGRVSQQGLGAIAAIVVVVVMAALAASIMRLSSAQQGGLAQDLQAARAAAAARSGAEWGLYQALKGGWTSCAGASSTLDLRSESGMRVTVSCSSSTYNEGESSPGVAQSLRVYTIDAVACNGSAGSCPDAGSAVAPTYVERRLRVQATDR
jgi:MSHA biogenesis protein MshP